ncbi:MAG: hypothetical protein Q8O88_04955 [bacterium]|nr:hypothetical protein [bacterium]
MARVQDLRRQSIAPSEPGTDVAVVYADSGNNALFIYISGEEPQQVGIKYTGSYEQVSVASGQGVMNTGVFFGGTGVGTVPATGLVSPYQWLPVVSSDGTNLVIPAYLMAP